MLIEGIVLGSILYYGYNELKKTDDQEKLVKFRQKKNFHSASLAKNMKRLLREADNKTEKGKKPVSNFQIDHQKNAIAVGTSLAITGSGFFTPVGVALSPLAIPLLLYSHREVYRKTFKLLKHGEVNVDTVMAITLLGLLLRGGFFLASFLSTVIMTALYLTDRVAYKARLQLTEVFDEHPEYVWVLVDGVEIHILFEQLKVGDVVVVRAGEIIPADGKIIQGMASVDQHILTGEAQPIEKEVGDDVFSSTIVLSGRLHFQVEKAGEETTVAKIKQILQDTIEYKSTTQLRAETFSQQLVKPVLIASGIAIPLMGVHGTLAVLSTHPKNKTMILSPITIMNYLSIASRQGILVKDGRSLELLRKVDVLVFDKTGTLTETQPHLSKIYCYADYHENQVLTYAAAAEHKQNHPLAKAILQAAKQRQLSWPELEDSAYQLGHGLQVKINGQTVHVGSERFMRKEQIPLPAALLSQLQQAYHDGYNLVLVALERQIIGAIELLPTVRSGTKELIARLKRDHNIKQTYIISGDHQAPTQKLAEELGIDGYFAQVMPQDKAKIIEQLQEKGHFVCYIGDGINDSIALKTAQVSISLKGASTIAVDTAQIILMDQGLNHLETLFNLTRQFNQNMNTTFVILLVPVVLGLTGAFLLGFGIAQTVMLNVTGLAIGIGNSMRPLLTYSQPPTNQPPKK